MKTPWNPSATATARVRNPLPAPTECPHCKSGVVLVNNSEVYRGKSYGEWPWCYKCVSCDAYVGLHPFTAIPLGTLATRAIRAARSRAKDAFNPLWQSGRMTRSGAYLWLAMQLGISDPEKCHIGWFDVEQCNLVVQVCGGQKDPHRHDTKTTGPKAFKPLCECDVLPWEHCEHTAEDDGADVRFLREMA